MKSIQIVRPIYHIYHTRFHHIILYHSIAFILFYYIIGELASCYLGSRSTDDIRNPDPENSLGVLCL